VIMLVSFFYRHCSRLLEHVETLDAKHSDLYHQSI